jgi:heme-degrading monooxygenase HmoA
MFVRIARHWCKPGQIDAGRDFIDRQGSAQASAPGFRFRYRLEPPEGPGIIATVTAWEDQAAFEKFRAGATTDRSAATYPFERVEDETFVVKSAFGRDPG